MRLTSCITILSIANYLSKILKFTSYFSVCPIYTYTDIVTNEDFLIGYAMTFMFITRANIGCGAEHI